MAPHHPQLGWALGGPLVASRLAVLGRAFEPPFVALLEALVAPHLTILGWPRQWPVVAPLLAVLGQAFEWPFVAPRLAVLGRAQSGPVLAGADPTLELAGRRSTIPAARTRRRL